VQPDLDELPEPKYNWCHRMYGKVEELLPKDEPIQLGNKVTTITYTD
jgi:hypothetical protein